MKHRLHTSKYERDRDERIKAARKRTEQEKRLKYKDALVSDSFRGVKRKFVIGALVKSVICGLSAGIFAVGLLMIIFKLTATPFDIIYYVLAGLGCALVCGGVTFLFLKPDNKKVAKTVDDEFGLKEQVQTSLAFSRETGSVVEMQRERAEGTVKALPRRKVKFSQIWQYFVIAVVAIALAVAAIFVPPKEVEAAHGPNDPTVSVTDNHRIRINDIIENIRNSALADEEDPYFEAYGDAELAEAIIAELQAFAAKLEEADSREEEIALSEVNGVIDRINKLVVDSTNYLTVAKAISDSAEASKDDTDQDPDAVEIKDYVSPIIKAGGDSYRTYRIFGAYKAVEDFLGECSLTTNSKISKKQDDLSGWLFPEEEESGDENGDETGGTAQTAAESQPDDSAKMALMIKKMTGVRFMLNAATEDLESNLLSDSVKIFTADLAAAYSAPADLNDLKDKTTQAIDKFVTSISDELSRQSYHLALERYVGNAIREIFGMELIQPDEAESDSGASAGPGNNNNNESGGTGPGDFRYPADDYVYDRRDDEMKFYGSLLQEEYDALINNFIEENGDQLTEEQKKMIEEYRNALYGNSAE